MEPSAVRLRDSSWLWRLIEYLAGFTPGLCGRCEQPGGALLNLLLPDVPRRVQHSHHDDPVFERPIEDHIILDRRAAKISRKFGARSSYQIVPGKVNNPFIENPHPPVGLELAVSRDELPDLLEIRDACL